MRIWQRIDNAIARGIIDKLHSIGRCNARLQFTPEVRAELIHALRATANAIEQQRSEAELAGTKRGLG